MPNKFQSQLHTGNVHCPRWVSTMAVWFVVDSYLVGIYDDIKMAAEIEQPITVKPYIVVTGYLVDDSRSSTIYVYIMAEGYW